MKITPLGDSAVIIHVSADAKDTAGRTLSEVLRARRAIENARIPGVTECASAYETVAVFFDAFEVMRNGAQPDSVTDWIAEEIRKALRNSKKHAASKTGKRFMEVPICCDPEFALDLPEVARHAGIAEQEVMDLYCAAEYQVAAIGFTPGFPFLSGLPAPLRTPRRSTPRTQIPAGSVAIGGKQTGIYSLSSPGGWNVIGRTPLVLFDPGRTAPALFEPGDRLQFRPIAREEFQSWQAEKSGT
jgi:inhibitor of KinA